VGGTVIALSVQECNAVEIVAGMRPSGSGSFACGGRPMPSLAVSGAALRMVGMALPRTPMVAAAIVLFLLLRPMRPVWRMRLMRLKRPRLCVAAAVGRLDRRAEQPLDVA
jgi:hypothetical protein